MGKPRRSFTREFKVEAVQRVTEQARSFAEAAANLGIAESLLRKWKQNLDAEGDQALSGEIQAIHQEVKERYGSPRMHAELQARGHSCCVNTVAKLMRQHGIAAKTKRKFRCTTDSNHSLKKELVHQESYATRAEARASIFEHIEVFYNRVRRHSALGYLSPVEYEQAA
jgi:transposase InsO family protein